MENIIELANQYIIRSGISALPVDTVCLERLFSSFGFTVISYNRGYEIIKTLGLTEYIALHKAFTAVLGDIKTVMFRDTLSTADRQFCLAHELGHIVLGHTPAGILGKNDNAGLNNVQELEADDFAFALLAPAAVIDRCGYSVSEICRCTLLSESYAGEIVLKLKNYNFGISDALVADAFSDYINQNTRQKRRKTISLYFPHSSRTVSPSRL